MCNWLTSLIVGIGSLSQSVAIAPFANRRLFGRGPDVTEVQPRTGGLTGYFLRETTTKPRSIMVMSKVRRLVTGGTLIVGLVALLSIGIGQNIHSIPAKPDGHTAALGNGVTVTMNVKTGQIVGLGNGVTVTMNVKTGQIVSVISMPKANR
jgi:hypothetical protein